MITSKGDLVINSGMIVISGLIILEKRSRESRWGC